MWIMDLGKPTTVPHLNEAMAIELGANLLGEGIIFVIAAGVLLLEYTRQVRKESAKEKARQDEMDTIHYTIQELYFQNEKQDAQIRELTRLVMDLQTSVVQKPWKSSKKVPENILPPPCPPELENPSTDDSQKQSPSEVPCAPVTENEKRLGFFVRAFEYFKTDEKGER